MWLAAEYSGEFSYLNFSMKIRQKIDEWMNTAAPEVLRPCVVGFDLANLKRLQQRPSRSRSDGEQPSCILDQPGYPRPSLVSRLVMLQIS